MILIDTIIFKTGYQFWFNTLTLEYDKRLEGILTQEELFIIINQFNKIIIQNNYFVLSCLTFTMILVVSAIPLIINGLLFWWLLLLLGIILTLSIQWFIQFQYKNDNLSSNELALNLSEQYKDRSITFNWKKITYNSKFGGSYFLSITHPRPFYANKESSSSLNKILIYYSNKHLLDNNETEKIINDINSSSAYNNKLNKVGDEESNEEGIPLLSSQKSVNYKDLVVN